MSAERKLALITGASEGLGVEFARLFSERGHDLALVARRQDRLDSLADEIAGKGRPRPIVITADLSAPDAHDHVSGRLAEEDASVEYLVNNAGYGLTGRFDLLALDDQLNCIDLNVRTLTALSHRFAPDLRRLRGGLLNVASVAAFAPGPGMAIYYATKAFVLSLTEALAEEMRPHGVRVTALCPGPVTTGFQRRAGMSASSAKAPPGAADAVATVRAGYDGLMAGRRVVVPGLVNKGLAASLAWIPHDLLLPALSARQSARRDGKT